MKNSANKGTSEYISQLSSMKKSMSKLFNTDMSRITDKFVEDHLDQLDKMANGTKEEAMAAQDAIENDLVASILAADGISATATVKVDGKDQVINILDTLQNQLDQYDGEDVGFTITADTSPAISNMQSLLDAGVMTADQVQEALNAIGWEPEIKWETIPLNDTQVGSEYATVTDSAGHSHTVKVTEEMRSTKTVTIPVIGSASKISKPGGGSRPTKSGGGGGGGSDPKTKDKKDKWDIERYHKINQMLELQSKLLDRNDKLKNRAYGAGYLNMLKKENKELAAQNDLYKDKWKEAEDWMKQDRAELEANGATFDGDVLNYTDYMSKLYDEYNAMVDKYNSMSADEQEAYEDTWDAFEEEWQHKVDLVEKYEEAQKLAEEM